MTIVSHSIPFVPANGGTLASNTGKTCSAVRLTPTRMVVVYHQTGPARRVFTILDNPNGFNSSQAPTVYNAVYSDTSVMTSAGSVKMVRLSNDTFLLAWNNNNGTVWLLHVFKVTQNTISLVYNTSMTLGQYDNGNDYPLAFGPAQQSIAFIPLGDNVVLINNTVSSLWTGNPSHNTQDFFNIQIRWDGSTLVQMQNTKNWDAQQGQPLGWGYIQSYVTQIYPWLTMDVYYINRPGTDKVYQVFRGVPSRTPKTDAVGYQRCYFRSINKPALTTQPWTFGSFKYLPDNYDLAFSGSDYQVLSDWRSSYYLTDAEAGGLPENYLSGASRVPTRGGGVHTEINPGDAAASTPFVLAFDTNYHTVIDRRHFVNPDNPFQMKIVRRVDTGTTESSPASTGSYGFIVDVPKISVFWDKPRPFLIDNDIVWFGVTTDNKFAYNVIKQPPLPN